MVKPKSKYQMPEPEKLDPTPMELPVDADEPETMEEIIQRLVRTQISQIAVAQGDGSFEDEDDFEEEDGYLLDFTAYELDAAEAEQVPQEGDFPEGSEETTPTSPPEPPVDGSQAELAEGDPSEAPSPSEGQSSP